MTNAFLQELVETMGALGFRQVPDASKSIPNADLLLKRQTWNTNRAVVVVSLPEVPADFGRYLSELRKRVAFRCGFFPVFWSIGIQVVAMAPGLAKSGIDPADHVSRVDNQWAIIQSLFLVVPAAKTFRASRTWGQFVSGQFQNAIDSVLARHFQTLEG